MNSVITIDPLTDPRWSALFETHTSTVFHTPAWFQVLSDTYHFPVCAYLVVNETGSPLAGLPVCQIADIRGERLVTMPFSDYHDPLVSTPEEWRQVTEQIISAARPYTVRCLHNTIPLQDERFVLKNRARWHGIDLAQDEETLWRGLDGAARRAISKAERSGILLRVAQDKSDLRAFFALHLQLRKYKYHLLAQPYAFFENIWQHFIETNQGLLLMALHNQQVVGATLFLEWRNTLFYKFNVSAPTDLNFRPNDLMMWYGIRYAKAKGYTYLDLGLSDWDQDGLIQYKRKFASEEKTISFLHYQPSAWHNEQTHEINKLLPHLTDLCTDESVPDAVTERAGELLYRFFV